MNKMNRGQIFVALILFVGGIILLIGLTLAILEASFVDTGYGYQASVQAEAAATSGAEDALLQLDRNPGFASNGYVVAVGSSTATVSVANTAGIITIIATAVVSNRTKKVSVTAAVSTSTNQVAVTAWTVIQ